VVVHLIAEQSKTPKIGKTTVTTKCGEQHHRNSAARLPEHLTAWHQDVTCEGCLA
jgi:hypothetical protein